MAAIDNLRAHFSRQQVRVIEVPEWAGDDGRPLLIYAKPLTLADKQKLRHLALNGGELEVLAQTLIMKAEDECGGRLFTVADKHALMHSVDPDVLARVASHITRPRTEEEFEALEKK